jgi:hypothetical protein
MRKKVLFAVACAALTLGGLQAKHGHDKDDDDYGHDREYRGHYRDDYDRDHDRYEHRQNLPPGLERQLVRNGHLPPGLEKKMHPVPVEVCRRLPPPPPDCVRGYYGGHVIFYNPRTSVIFNVFAGITLSR